MSLTVKYLKEVLNRMKDDVIVHNEQNEDFIHIFTDDGRLRLSTTKPIGTCNRTGEYVYPSIIEGYSAFCPKLDEDLYDMEWTPNDDNDNRFICGVCGEHVNEYTYNKEKDVDECNNCKDN